MALSPPINMKVTMQGFFFASFLYFAPAITLLLTSTPVVHTPFQYSNAINMPLANRIYNLSHVRTVFQE